MDFLQDGFEEGGFVVKVIVQRPTGHARPLDQLFRGGAGIAHLGKQLPPHVKQGAPGPVRAFSVRDSRCHNRHLPRQHR